MKGITENIPAKDRVNIFVSTKAMDSTKVPVSFIGKSQSPGFSTVRATMLPK